MISDLGGSAGDAGSGARVKRGYGFEWVFLILIVLGTIKIGDNRSLPHSETAFRSTWHRPIAGV